MTAGSTGHVVTEAARDGTGQQLDGVPGVFTVHGRTATFTGDQLQVGSVRLPFAHVQIIMNKTPCGGSGQSPNAGAGTFIGTYQYVAA